MSIYTYAYTLVIKMSHQLRRRGVEHIAPVQFVYFGLQAFLKLR